MKHWIHSVVGCDAAGPGAHFILCWWWYRYLSPQPCGHSSNLQVLKSVFALFDGPPRWVGAPIPTLKYGLQARTVGDAGIVQPSCILIPPPTYLLCLPFRTFPRHAGLMTIGALKYFNADHSRSRFATSVHMLQIVATNGFNTSPSSRRALGSRSPHGHGRASP